MRRLGIVAALVLLASVPLWVGSTYYVNISSQILFYAIFALGVNVLAGHAGLVSLGHAGLFGIAAYSGAKILNDGHGHVAVVAGALALTASAEALLMVIAGGTATLLGPIAGAAVVVVVKNVASAYIERWNFVLGAIFVVIVVFMPEGLVPGTARRWRRVMAALRPRATAAG